MQNSWLTVLPALLVLFVAIFKRNVILALLTGIISAALIASNFSITNTVSLIFYRLTHELTPDHLYTFGFLIILGIIISLITLTGGILAYSQIIQSKLKTKKNTETTSLVLSSMFFLDDYLNSLIVGCIMRPLTDKLKIPRAKLAFLLDSLSAPLCVLIPVSSWVALILTQLETSGINNKNSNNLLVFADPLGVYLRSILYMFYPILLIITTWIIVRKQISFGPMHQHEITAQETGNLFNNKKPIDLKIPNCTTSGNILDFIIPISIFLIGTIGFLLYSGDWSLFLGQNNFINALLDANPFFALFAASILSLIISISYLYTKNRISVNDIKTISISGFDLMKNSLLVLLLAWIFGSILREDLGTGQYLANTLLQDVPSFTLPVIIFISSIIVSAGTGSAWGTIAIMMPLAIPFVVLISDFPVPLSLNQAQLLLPVIGALISGAIAGGHISPISDSTVLAATSAGSYHIDHLITQIGYVIPPIIGSILALLFTGIFSQYNQFIIVPISLIIGILTSIIILYLSQKYFKKTN